MCFRTRSLFSFICISSQTSVRDGPSKWKMKVEINSWGPGKRGCLSSLRPEQRGSFFLRRESDQRWSLRSWLPELLGMTRGERRNHDCRFRLGTEGGKLLFSQMSWRFCAWVIFTHGTNLSSQQQESMDPIYTWDRRKSMWKEVQQTPVLIASLLLGQVAITFWATYIVCKVTLQTLFFWSLNEIM